MWEGVRGTNTSVSATMTIPQSKAQRGRHIRNFYWKHKRNNPWEEDTAERMGRATVLGASGEKFRKVGTPTLQPFIVSEEKQTFAGIIKSITKLTNSTINLVWNQTAKGTHRQQEISLLGNIWQICEFDVEGHWFLFLPLLLYRFFEVTEGKEAPRWRMK